MQTWNITNSAWDVYQDQGNLSGYYDDFEYRIVYRNTQDSGSSPASGNCLRNVYLTVTRTTK